MIGGLIVALCFTAFVIAKALQGSHSSAATTSGPQPTKAQQHAVGALSAFVYERGSWWEGGNVKACHANWQPQRDAVALLNCRAFGRPTIYTRFRTTAQATRYFNQLASQGRPATGDWGRCARWLPRSPWTRRVFGRRENGEVAFRQVGANATVVWSWPNMQTIAEVRGSVDSRAALCSAWLLNA